MHYVVQFMNEIRGAISPNIKACHEIDIVDCEETNVSSVACGKLSLERPVEGPDQ
jgi:hypothetical protein